MQKTYNFKNGRVIVSTPETEDYSGLRKATENFLRKVIEERMKHGNSNTSGNFREE